MRTNPRLDPRNAREVTPTCPLVGRLRPAVARAAVLAGLRARLAIAWGPTARRFGHALGVATLFLAAAPADGSARDQLWLRQGDPWIGQLVNPHLEIQTPYAHLEIPTRDISNAWLGEGPQQLDRIATRSGDRFTGFILDPHLVFDPESGPRLNLRRDQVARLALHRPGAAPVVDGKAPDRLVFLRNGDRIAGRILGGPFRLGMPQTDVMLTLTNLASITFLDTHPVLAAVRTTRGDKLEGVWPDLDLEIELGIGLTLGIHPSRISSIDTPAVPLPDRTPAQTGDTPADPGGANGSVTNDLEWVWIPPGEFLMGSPSEEEERDLDEGPQTRVRITRGFWMGRCEITQAQYREVMGVNPSLFIGDLRRPVEKVRHRDALEFCARLTQQHRAEGRLPDHHVYRLPTEAEWEYACRAGMQTRFSHGDDPLGYQLEAYAWFNANSDSSTQPVGTRKPNPWGLYDMHGNVLEWCLDGGSSPLPGGEVQDPLAPPDGILRIARGGSWLYGAKTCRSANRDSYGESTRSSDLGFRMVLAPAR